MNKYKEVEYMRVLNFIVLEDKIRKSGFHDVAVSGEVYIPLETVVPVICKGVGCVGVGVVQRLHISKSSTTIEFELETNISKESKRAYYDLYRNHSSSDYENDPYENSDTVIPGAIGSVGGKTSGRVTNSQYSWKDDYRRDKNPSLGDFLGDDFMDD
jgi:hypothetical protein